MAAESGIKITKEEALKKVKDGLDVWDDIFAYGTNPNPKTVDEVVAAFDKPEAKEMWAAGALDQKDPAVMMSFRRNGSILPEDRVRFRWYGIYQQLPNFCYFMLRIRIPNGFLTPAQLREVAAITQDHARGFCDITTRQCIQLHWLTIESFADILPRLEKVGLVSKFACGDTPRNVVGCPLAGHLPNEILDARSAVNATNKMFLDGHKEFSNFPRKFKSAIAGCHLNCHQPQINDIGAFGVIRKNPATGVEERGFGIMVGGGLSTAPYMAQSLRIFVTPEQMPIVSRGIAHIFRDFGYREKRTRARMKFLVADWGWQKFRDALEKELGFTLEHDDSIVGPVAAPHTDHMGSGPQKQAGLSYIGVPIERGRITAEQMHAAADLAGRFGGEQALIGLSNKQNLLFMNIPTGQVKTMSKELESRGLQPYAPIWRTNLISCTGTQFCNLAIVETKQRAAGILKFLETECEIDTPIMVSVTGCPNSCGQFQIADIGLMGVVCNFRGQRGTEAYNILLGGALGADAKFATLTTKKVPADYVHKSIKGIVDAYKANRVDAEEPFSAFVRRNTPEQLGQWLTIPEMAEVV